MGRAIPGTTVTCPDVHHRRRAWRRRQKDSAGSWAGLMRARICRMRWPAGRSRQAGPGRPRRPRDGVGFCRAGRCRPKRSGRPEVRAAPKGKELSDYRYSALSCPQDFDFTGIGVQVATFAQAEGEEPESPLVIG